MNTTTSHNETDALIERYLTDHTDSEAVNALKNLALKSGDEREYIRRRLELWFSAGVAGDSYAYDADKAYDRFLSRKEAEEAEQKAVRRHPMWIKSLIAAAAVALIVLLPLGGFWFGQDRMENRFADISVSTADGAPTQLSLPDGTKVWLNAGSTISYSQGFGVNNRNVKLNGEACFDVRHNEKLPFTITTDDINLRVLGTKFTFCDYPGDENITVDLIRGKVSLTANATGSSMTLTADERMVFNRSTHSMKKMSISAQSSDSWTRGELFFDERPLEDIARTLSRRYGVEIEVADNLKRKPFYGTFNTQNSSVTDVLNIMSETRQMRYRYSNGKYVIY